MKKIIFILIVIVSIVFVSCEVVSTEIKVANLSTSKTEFVATFTDFFNPVELVYSDTDNAFAAIVMDKNTGVLYVWKHSGYKWGMSPIYDSAGSVLTKEKWLTRHVERKNPN